MTWMNWTVDGWHIDHIIPLDQGKNEEDAKKLYMATPMGKNFEQKNPGMSVLSLPNGGGYLYLRIAYKKWIDKLKIEVLHLVQ